MKGRALGVPCRCVYGRPEFRAIRDKNVAFRVEGIRSREGGYTTDGRQENALGRWLAGQAKGQAGRGRRRRKLPDEIVGDRGKRAYGCRCLFVPQ